MAAVTLGSILIAMAVLAPVEASSPPTQTPTEEAEALVEEAVRADAEGRLDEASDLLRRAYVLVPSSVYLYARAQVERRRNNCRLALELYQNYLDFGVSEEDADTVRAGIRECRRQLAREESVAATPSEGEPSPESDAQADASDSASAPRRASAPWYRDRWGTALVATGAGLIVVGGALYGGAAVTAGRAPAQGDEGSFHRQLQRTRALEAIAITGLALGATVSVIGIVRYASVRRRRVMVGAAASSGDYRVVLHGRF